MSLEGLVADMDSAAISVLGESTPVTYAPASGAPVLVSGIFDNPYELAQDAGAPAGVESLAPAVFLQLADLPTDPEVDDPILTIKGVQYRVSERCPAGPGAIYLRLRKVG